MQEELETLQTVRRKEVAERLKEAISYGDLSENAEYEEAKNEQAFIEGRILTLENLINKAVLISEGKNPSGTVQVGSKVIVADEKGKESEYFIVGSTEADPSQRKISNVSPIGKALLGKRVGGVAEVRVPAGRIKLKVKKIQ